MSCETLVLTLASPCSPGYCVLEERTGYWLFYRDVLHHTRLLSDTEYTILLLISDNVYINECKRFKKKKKKEKNYAASGGYHSFISFQMVPGCSLDQGSLCPINQLFCLSRQALHRPPPAPMKEHRLSPMREEPLPAPVNEEGSQNVGAGAASGCQPGNVGSAGSNKKPRSRTKVQFWMISLSGPIK